MRVLSIDLDYIMGPVIELYNGLMFNENPTIRWEQFFNKTDFNESHFRIDQSNLLFCYNTFLKALRNCDSVSFGYEHDSILFSIAEYENIDLINIDHHDDVFGGDYTGEMPDEYAYKTEFYEIMEHNLIIIILITFLCVCRRNIFRQITGTTLPCSSVHLKNLSERML